MNIAFQKSLNFILAHPGHGTIPADSPTHYLLEPEHAVGLVLFLMIAAIATLLFVRMRQGGWRWSWMKRNAESLSRVPKAEKRR